MSLLDSHHHTSPRFRNSCRSYSLRMSVYTYIEVTYWSWFIIIPTYSAPPYCPRIASEPVCEGERARIRHVGYKRVVRTHVQGGRATAEPHKRGGEATSHEAAWAAGTVWPPCGGSVRSDESCGWPMCGRCVLDASAVCLCVTVCDATRRAPGSW